MHVIQPRAAAPAPARKTVLHILCVVLAMVLLSVPAFAVQLPEAVPENGNTVIGTFITSDLHESSKEILRRWLASNRNMLVRKSDGSYVFLTISDGVTVTVSPGSGGRARIRFNGSNGVVASGISMMGWTASTPEFNGSATWSCANGAGFDDCIIISGTIFDSANITLPMPTSGYLAEYTGQLLLKDDGGLFGSEGEGSWWQGLLDWLASFWDTLKAFFIGLFVPEQGYFDKWVSELRAAANAKLGPVADLSDAIKELFESLQSDAGQTGGFKITLPPNLLYQGYKGAEADLMPTILRFTGWLRPVLNAFVLLFTAIVCYRRVVVLFEQ